MCMRAHSLSLPDVHMQVLPSCFMCTKARSHPDTHRRTCVTWARTHVTGAHSFTHTHTYTLPCVAPTHVSWVPKKKTWYLLEEDFTAASGISSIWWGRDRKCWVGRGAKRRKPYCPQQPPLFPQSSPRPNHGHGVTCQANPLWRTRLQTLPSQNALPQSLPGGPSLHVPPGCVSPLRHDGITAHKG